MATTRVTLTLPTDLVEEARRASDNLSRIVAEALREYLRQRKQDLARQAFGAWSRPADFDSCAFVERLRAEPGEGRLAGPAD